MHSQLKLIATGGTFDKTYNPIAGVLDFDESHLVSLAKKCRIIPEPAVEVLMLIDSLDMQDAHRQTILHAVQHSSEQQIVIIHGTDTMVETAQMLGHHVLAGKALINKTVVITGAMVPVDIKDSDGQFNLGFAIGCALSQNPGVYIAMNGAVHPWNNVRKNKALGIFEKL
jgi:L-asparaginase